ncbi:disease resistance RPP8-like protein 3 [Pistacia vera]|uniref:disease resistance RPP8-like protein 3 n=1 Tax=Pistacia vera TaxID=55513 RepID=UPI0012639106|nr:disease resistance RPP8-like protein 3 [Pistacia vera]
MAEAAVNSVIQILSSFLVQEIQLLGNAKQGVEDIKRGLESIRSFLKDADRAAEGETRGNKGVKTWVNQLREEVFRIEDAIDEYTMKAARLPHGRGFVCYIHKACYFIKIQKLQRGITTKIKDIELSLANILRRGEIYNFKHIDQGPGSGGRSVITHDSRVGSIFIEDAEVVGIESTKEKLISLLVEGTSNIRSMIAVVGEGGLGKTTLTGKIYNNEAVKKHFDCQAWITVGKEYLKKDLLRTILQEFYRSTGPTRMEANRMDEMNLIMKLSEHLKDKCYMIVFDEVWKIENLEGRKKTFCRKAFGSDSCCLANLTELSKRIVGKCGGLPLTIVAIEDYKISFGKLVRLWIAESFVQCNDHLPSEHVAEEYLKELIDRSLVQVSETKASG